MSTGKRYVVLIFDDGDRFDYEPPLPHPADVFLERFPKDFYLNAELDHDWGMVKLPWPTLR